MNINTILQQKIFAYRQYRIFVECKISYIAMALKSICCNKHTKRVKCNKIGIIVAFYIFFLLLYAINTILYINCGYIDMGVIYV